MTAQRDGPVAASAARFRFRGAGVAAMLHDRLPPIAITTADAERLHSVVETWAERNLRVAGLLAHELDRASIVDPGAVSPDLVTMGSRVAFRLNGECDIKADLVYPGEEDVLQGRISVATPVGTALLGLSAGQALELALPGRRTLAVAISRLLYQPEAAGQQDAGCGVGG